MLADSYCLLLPYLGLGVLITIKMLLKASLFRSDIAGGFLYFYFLNSCNKLQTSLIFHSPTLKPTPRPPTPTPNPSFHPQ